MKIKTTIGQYEYEAQLLNLFDHPDFGQRYSTILASGASSPEVVKKIEEAAKLKDSDDPSDIEKRNRLNAEVGMACVMGLSKEKQAELRDMKMTALVEGQCWAKRIGEPDTHKKPIYEKAAFSKHFRESATPKEMTQVLDWLIGENVRDFLA